MDQLFEEAVRVSVATPENAGAERALSSLQSPAQQAAAEAAEAATQAAAQAAEQAAAQQGAPPPPPAAPPAPGAAAPGVIGVDVPGLGTVVPLTRDQVRALERRGSDLSDQLQSVQRRRDNLVEELEQATSPQVQAGLEARIAQLDARLLTIEKDLQANSELKASFAAKLGTTQAETRESEDREPPVINAWGPFTEPVLFFTMLPIALAGARFLWKRGNRPPVVPISREAEVRFQQMEQSIDSVAIEIERVAEGQRFVTKLLREGQPIPDFSAGRAAEPVRVRTDAESVR
jgi:hypothetical protein